MRSLRVVAPSLYPLQAEIARDPARFKVVAAGRRCGKTFLGTWLCYSVAARSGQAWWVAPTYSVARVGWNLIRRLAIQIPGATVSESQKIVSLPNGGVIAVRSADNPDSLRGDSLDLVVIDEAAFVSERAWTEALRPALSDRQGGALFISTPNGKNYFFKHYLWGQDSTREGWKSWQLPTRANPHIDPLEIAAAERDLPSSVFRQEYLAEFIDDGGIVFRNLSACFGDYESLPPVKGATYAIGVDWGQANDFTVVTVIDTSADPMRVVFLDRFNQLPWELMVARVESTFRTYDCSLAFIETNSIGQGPFETLSKTIPVEAFVTTADSKARVVQNLAVAFEKELLILPRNDNLKNELSMFSAKRLPSGRWSYGAPDGAHDDTVISLALAWDRARTPRGVLFA